MAAIAQPYQTYQNIARWIRIPTLLIIIAGTIVGGVIAANVSFALEEQFDVGDFIPGAVGFIGIASLVIGAISLIISTSSDNDVTPEDTATIGGIGLVMMWMIAALQLLLLPTEVNVDKKASVMHVMPDGTTHFPGSSYKRALSPPGVREVVPLTYEVGFYFDSNESLGQTGKIVVLRTSITTTVRFATNDALSEEIRSYMKQGNISVEKTLANKASTLATGLIERFQEEYPNKQLKDGMRLPYSMPSLDSITIVSVTSQIK